MAPSIPTWFEEALEREFQGLLRIRWSEKRREWHIEQKVGRGIFTPPKAVEVEDDRWIRARDGYAFFAAVQSTPHRRCPECHLMMDVPQCAFREVRCDYCGFKGLSGRLVLAYFPLGEKLLEHLRKHDPYRDRIRKNVAEADRQNQLRDIREDHAATNSRQDFLYEGLEATHFASAGFPGKAKDYNLSLFKE
jgi:DNA-directed RNA polymerase subunit RPC12/RpoP